MPIPAIVAAPAIGAAIGKVFDIGSGKRQLKQQAKLQALQIQGQKEMADYNMQKELQMWKDTNYQAQMEQLKMAGLNPGLIYGMSGGGGQTTGSPQASITGATAPTDTHMSQMLMSGLQMGILKAQKENIEASTAKTQAETTNIPKIGQQIEQDTLLAKAKTEFQKLETSFGQQSFDDRIEQINRTTEKLLQESKLLNQQNQITAETMTDQIKQIKTQAVGAILHNALTQSQTAANQQQIQESKAKVEQIAAEILQKWEALRIQQGQLETGQYEATIKAFEAQFKADYPSIWNVAGKTANEAITGIIETLTGQKRNTIVK